MTTLPRKKQVKEIDRQLLAEPPMSAEDWREYEEGWRLFNDRQFWLAHEAWEGIWRRRPEESRIFFQGIIQLAAGCHLLIVEKRYSGAIRNLEKAEEKLIIFPSPFLRVDVNMLLQTIDYVRFGMERVGKDRLGEFDISLIARVNLRYFEGL